MYTTRNFKSKAELKRALAAGEKLTVFQANDMFGNTEKARIGTQTVYLEGPHYPAAHTWYAKATLVEGYIVKVS